MIKRRIDEDFKHVWAINWNGLPEDFSDATEIVLTASVYGKKKQLERGIDYVIEGNLIIVDFTPRFAMIAGIYNLELRYIKPSDGFIDGERRSAVDIDAVQIVAKSSQVTDTGDITSTSEAMIGLKGDKGDKGDKGEKGDQGLKGDTGAKGADGTMSFEDLTPEQKESLKGDQGEPGPKGDKGDKGEKGDPGVAGDISTSISITSEDLVLIGRYIAEGGTLGNSSVSNTSNLIPCQDAHYVSLMFQTIDATSAYFGFAFYDKSEQFIERISAELDPSGVRGGRKRTLKIPSNAHYLRCQYCNEEKRIEYDAPEFYLTLDGTDVLFEQIAEISSGLNPMYTQEDLTIENRYMRYYNDAGLGDERSSSASDSTGFLRCNNFSALTLMQPVWPTSYTGLGFYSKDFELISYTRGKSGENNTSYETTIEVPENAYYFRTTYWDKETIEEYNLPEFYVLAGTLAENINELYSRVKNTPSGDTYGLNPIYTQEDLTIEKGYVKYRDDRNPDAIGTVPSSASSDCTGFLKCNNFRNLTLMQPGWATGFAGVGFYNKDFELISYIVNKSGENNTSYETTIEVPENAYYFRTTYWDKEAIEEYNLPEFYVVAGTLVENINELYSRVRTTSSTSSGGSYTVSFTAEKVIVANVATNGSITFDLIGSDTLSGNFTDTEVLKGGKLIRKVEDEFKVMNVTFDLMSDSAPLQIYTHTTYKVDTEIENDGIEGICSGDMGFLKDENVFVEGNPMIAGFTDNAKTKFALCADYGSMTPHYDKLEEVEYTDIDVVKGERKFAKLSVLKEESPLRLLNQPNGYNATFTFASHADRTTVPITKAIFYGTDNEASPTYNTNGLLSYGIKGTMSVFAEGHTSSHAALDNASYKALIDDAYSKGIEIIPHTLTYDPDTRAGAERMLPFFKDNYSSRNWIDHYLRQDNPSIGHHSKGNDTESPHYIMDLMEQYGYDYSWCYIDTTPDGVVRNQLFEEHYQFRRDLLFKNKKLTFPDGTPMWQYKNTWKMFETIIGNGAYDEIEHIQNLIDTCNVWAEHSYLTATYGQLWKKVGSETVIDPKFDSMLSFVKDKKEAGEIWNPTQSEYNDNLAKLMDISIVRSGVGQYKVFSKNEESVNCSFLLKNTFKDVYLNGVLAEAKVSGDNMIFWGDIRQGENAITVS